MIVIPNKMPKIKYKYPELKFKKVLIEVMGKLPIIS